MRSVMRWVGIWMVAGAFMALVVDGVNWLADRAFNFTPLGQFLYWLSPGGLNVTQAFVERYITPLLWDPVIVTMLNLPVWAIGGVLGFILVFAGRRRPVPVYV